MKRDIDGLTVHYEQSGSGPIVVLLHGWGASLEDFADLAESLTEKYTVLSLDLPGFGASSQPASNWGIREYAKFVMQFYQTLKLEDPYAFIGHSFGGRIIIRSISDGLLKPKKVVFIGSAGIRQSATLRNQVYKVIAKSGKQILRLPGLQKYAATARTKLYEQANSQDYLHAGTMRQIFLKTINEDLRHDIKKITIPTLLIWGAKDTETPISSARYFQQNITGSTLKIVQNAGHYVHNEYPKKVAKWVQEFLG